MKKIKHRQRRRLPSPGKNAARNAADLRPGEVIEFTTPFGLPPPGIKSRVAEVRDGMLHYSVGEICGGAAIDFIELTSRNIEEPVDWDCEELKYLEASAAFCRCRECRDLARKKRAQIAARGAVLH